MGLGIFQIDIIEQGWLKGSAAEEDLCSHGRIRLMMGGQLVLADEEQYGISVSALALLRTLDSDHSVERPVAERLILCGCGTILMMTCPIGVNWSVSHRAGIVHIDDIVRYDTTNEAVAVKFSGLSVDVPLEEYRREIVAFAREAKRPFEGVTKTPYDEFDKKQYVDFWEEYNLLLERHNNGN